MEKTGDIRIPPLPLVTVQMMQFDAMSPDSSSALIERIVTPDKGVSAEMLRVANSSFYGRSGKVKTLRDAITLLGLKASKNLIILLGTRDMNGALKGPLLTRYLREFPIAAALTAQDLAVKLKKPELREEIFVGALLHKVGMTVLALNHPTKYPGLLQLIDQEGLDIREEEKRVFGVDHIELGAELSDRWKLPAELRETLTGHEFGVDQTAAVSDSLRITALASLASREMMSLLLPMSELNRRASIAAHYKGEEVVGQLNESYFAKLRVHPFFQQAVAA